MCIQYTNAYVLLHGGNIIEVKKEKGREEMYEIRVNDAFETYGLMSINIKKAEEGLVTEGVLKTHLYIEEIDSLECDRFRISGIDVLSESFGSNDPFVVYYFIFEDFEMFYENLEYDEKELLEMYKKASDNDGIDE